MKNRICFLSLFILFSLNGFCQVVNQAHLEKIAIDLGDVVQNNENFTNFDELKPLLQGVEIVMLGEQSHGEATTYETKIKLIKYLHQNLGFDILAFESGIFDCNKAWEKMQNGNDVRDAFGRGVLSTWSVEKELKPLSDYIEKSLKTDSPLELMGFDSQLFYKFSEEYLMDDLAKYLEKLSPEIVKSKKWQHLKNNYALFVKREFKQLKNNNPQQDTLFVNHLVNKLYQLESTDDSRFWIQTLKSLKCFISDLLLKTDFRDKQMADNLIWIKETNPNRKIICWGATSHFLYNSTKVRMSSPIVRLLGGNYYKKQAMMGDYIKKEYGEKVFAIGFTSYEGTYGANRTHKIKAPKEGAFEYQLGKLNHDNFLIPLHGLDIGGMESRPLANRYMTTDITKVMDAVIFNRYMRRPKLDNNFYLKLYPDNKYIKPVPVE